MDEAGYIDAFTKHFKRTVGFLRLRVPDQDMAMDYALEGWAKVWKTRERYDPAKSSIETWANRCCLQAMIDRRRTLWAQADVVSLESFHRLGKQSLRLEEHLPSALHVAPSSFFSLDAESILARCDFKTAAVLRRFYLEEQPTPKATVWKARNKAKERICR